MDRYQNVLKFGAFGLFAGAFYWYGKKLRKAQQQYQNVADLQVKSLKDLKNSKPNQQHLVKVLVANAPEMMYDQKVYTNQVYFVEPSDKLTLQKFRKKLEKDKVQWLVRDSSDKNAITKTVQNFGHVFGDFFTYTRKFEERQLGTFEAMWDNVAFFLEFIYSLVVPHKNNTHKINRRPLIMGPLKGILHYQIGLVTGSFLLLKCTINNEGNLVASMTGSSKKLVLDHYWNQIKSGYVRVIIASIGLVLASRWAYRFFKLKIQLWRTRMLSDAGVLLNPEQLPDSKLCIICYDNCRNAVFLDCRHCVLCAGCSKMYKQQVCPVCKNQIDCVKLIYNC